MLTLFELFIDILNLKYFFNKKTFCLVKMLKNVIKIQFFLIHLKFKSAGNYV
jgi:hypothetical protein